MSSTAIQYTAPVLPNQSRFQEATSVQYEFIIESPVKVRTAAEHVAFMNSIMVEPAIPDSIESNALLEAMQRPVSPINGFDLSQGK